MVSLNVDNPVEYGSPVSMACTAQLPSYDGAFTYLEWAKTPISSYISTELIALFGFHYYSSGRADPSPVYPSSDTHFPPEYTVTFDMNTGISFLNISSAVLQDTGYYWCSYSSGNNPRARESVQLSVYGEYVSENHFDIVTFALK